MLAAWPARPCLGLRLGSRLRARQRTGLSGLGGGLDQLEVRLGSVVRVEEPGLPAVEVGLVADVEEEQALDRGLTVGELDRPHVIGTLDRLRDGIQGRWDAEVRVGAELLERDLGLDSILAVKDRQRSSALSCSL